MGRVVPLVQQALVLGERADLTYRIDGIVYLRGLQRRQIPYGRSGKLQLRPTAPSEPALVPL